MKHELGSTLNTKCGLGTITGYRVFNNIEFYVVDVPYSGAVMRFFIKV